jgi:GT2 family glycosyltransferase
MITKLGVGIVTQEDIKAHTACSLIVALQHAGVPFQMLLAMGCYIHVNRQMIVDQAIQEGCSHLLFVDTDVVFGADAIKRLIDNNVDIVGGRYNKRIFPIESTVKDDISELSEVKFVPTGFLLINVDVLKKMDGKCFSHDGAESEDMYFCQKAIELGYKVYCDPTIQIGHIGTTIY